MLRRVVVHYLQRLVSLEDTTRRIALAFAVGVFFAFSPLLGLHTLLGLLVAFLFGLNRVAVLIGVFINNPWTLVPIYTLAGWVGGLLVGFPNRQALPRFGWQEIWQSDFWLSLVRHGTILKPVLLGSAVLSVVTALISYLLALMIVSRGRASAQDARTRAQGA
jgi:uncharacterized protein